ncbi:MAG: hypothetical protein IJY12_02025 [Clostridia bacterium]|nr:hypothetical protein [Clostridia bacterium]
MKFIKENSYTVVRLGLNQFGMAVFGFIVTMACAYINNSTLTTLGGLLATLMFWFLLYTVCWTEGGKHRIRVDGGRETKRIYNGALLGLLANSINLLLGIVYLITYYIGSTQEWAGNIAFMLNAILRIFHAMYLGLLMAGGLGGPIPFVIIPLIGILVCQISYLLGYHQINFLFMTKKSSK